MPASPFAKLTRKTRIKARLGRIKRALRRPFSPSRLTGDRPGPSNLLLIGIDTLRADHLGFGGHPNNSISPNLDRLAGGGTIFSNVTAPAPWTLPSFSSALTGVMPGLHGGFLSGEVRNMDNQPPGRLNEGIVTLAAHLRRQGYRTAAFYSNQFFAFGLAESFDHHQYHNLPADDLAAVARDWIRCHADQPFFCFILFNDPHEPTTPDLSDLAEFLPEDQMTDPETLVSLARWGHEPGGHLGYFENPDSETAIRVRTIKLALYDAAIRGVDRVVGKLQQQLESWGIAESTLVSVFADHGEEFLDHADYARRWNHDPREIRGIGHGHSHFQELLHVPWAAWGPGVPESVRRLEPISLCDLSPTLLDWLKLPGLKQPSLQGKLDALPQDLSAMLVGHSRAVETRDNDWENEYLAAEAIAFGPDLVAVRQGRWKMIARRDGFVLALFDLQTDPEEKMDRQQAETEVVQRMQKMLGLWRDSGTGAGSDGGGADKWDDLDDTVRQRLRDLGYSD